MEQKVQNIYTVNIVCDDIVGCDRNIDFECQSECSRVIECECTQWKENWKEFKEKYCVIL